MKRWRTPKRIAWQNPYQNGRLYASGDLTEEEQLLNPLHCCQLVPEDLGLCHFFGTESPARNSQGANDTLCTVAVFFLFWCRYDFRTLLPCQMFGGIAHILSWLLHALNLCAFWSLWAYGRRWCCDMHFGQHRSTYGRIPNFWLPWISSKNTLSPDSWDPWLWQR